MELALHYREVPTLQDLSLFRLCRHSGFKLTPRRVIELAGWRVAMFRGKSRLVSLSEKLSARFMLGFMISARDVGKEFRQERAGAQIQLLVDSGSAFGSAEFDLQAETYAEEGDGIFFVSMRGPLVPETGGFLTILRAVLERLPAMRRHLSDREREAPALPATLYCHYHCAMRISAGIVWVSHGYPPTESVEVKSVEQIARWLQRKTLIDRSRMSGWAVSRYC